MHYTGVIVLLYITPRASINVQLIDEAKTSRLTHIYTREWCNNFIPRRPVKKRKEQPSSQQNIVHTKTLFYIWPWFTALASRLAAGIITGTGCYHRI